MVIRSSAAALTAAAIIFLALAVVAATTVVLASPMSVLHDTASVARMPVPGGTVVKLDARSYGLYFGLLNPPTRRAMRVPKLSITIVPPDGIADPEFVEVPPGVDVLVDRFHTVQVARITVHTPGSYRVQVSSPEESGGSFSIGELPALLAWDRSLARAAPAILGFLGLSAILMISAVVAGRRARARSGGA